MVPRTYTTMRLGAKRPRDKTVSCLSNKRNALCASLRNILRISTLAIRRLPHPNIPLCAPLSRSVSRPLRNTRCQPVTHHFSPTSNPYLTPNKCPDEQGQSAHLRQPLGRRFECQQGNLVGPLRRRGACRRRPAKEWPP